MTRHDHTDVSQVVALFITYRFTCGIVRMFRQSIRS